MNIQKGFLIKSVISMIIFMTVTPGFSQVKKGETVPFTGIIKNISKDIKSILVNEVKIEISSDTKIFDEKGNSLKMSDLKLKLYVAVEAAKNQDGFLAKRIVVKKLKGD